MRPLGAHLDAEQKKLAAAAPPTRMVVAKLRGVDAPAKWSAGGGSRARRHHSIGLGQQERPRAESREESRSMKKAIREVPAGRVLARGRWRRWLA